MEKELFILFHEALKSLGNALTLSDEHLIFDHKKANDAIKFDLIPSHTKSVLSEVFHDFIPTTKSLLARDIKLINIHVEGHSVTPQDTHCLFFKPSASFPGKCITRDKHHYFSDSKSLEIVGNKLEIQTCFYSGKWRQDTSSYNNIEFLNGLFYHFEKSGISKIIERPFKS
jgi:hypothetical protein